MDPNAKKMLKYIKDPLHSMYITDYIPFDRFYDVYCEANSCATEMAEACVRYLESQQYIKYKEDVNGRVVGFVLEHKAYNSEYFTKEKIISFLLNSIVVPIVVSAITTFVIAIIKGWLQSPK